MAKTTRSDVTIVAHAVGMFGGEEGATARLVTGLLDHGLQICVVARKCELEPHPGLRFVRVPGPLRPASLARPLFVGLGSLIALRVRGRILHLVGPAVLNRADVMTVHFSNIGLRRRSRVRRRSRPGVLYRLNEWTNDRIAALLERWALRPGRVRQVVAVSRGLAAELEQDFGLRGDSVTVIPNGVDRDAYKPHSAAGAAARRELGVSDRDDVAVFVGGDWGRKRLEAAIAGVGMTSAWHLVVVGPGDVRRYARRARELGAGGRVHFVGRADPRAYYAAADAFLLPSAYETFGMAPYEAAAAGLPILVTRVSGIEDLVIDGVNGLYVRPQAADIAERLAVLSEDPERRRTMGAAARVAAGSYGWDGVVDGYIALYRSSTPR